jgi:hypothetical protein
MGKSSPKLLQLAQCHVNDGGRTARTLDERVRIVELVLDVRNHGLRRVRVHQPIDALRKDTIKMILDERSRQLGHKWPITDVVAEVVRHGAPRAREWSSD